MKNGSPVAERLRHMSEPPDDCLSGIVKTTKKMDAAKKLMDWTVTLEANQAYAKNFAIVAHPAVKPALPHIPADLESRLIKNDFAFAAKNRDKILAEWQKRYAAKSEPK